MYFCIRDDDTSFFTTPEELDGAYGEVAQWGPVSLAVIPFCRAGYSKGVPEKFRGRWSVHPLHSNPAIVDYLRDGICHGRFEIMLHGFHHDEHSGTGEFFAGRDLTTKVTEGRRYLEDLLGTQIRVFVAPRNIMGKDGLRAIVKAGLNFGGAIGVRAGWPLFSLNTWNNWLKLRSWRKQARAGIPWILDLRDHREIPGNAVTPAASLKRNKAALETALAVDGSFCAATHYWELSAPSRTPGDPPVGEHLRQLIDLARSDPRVRWCSVGETVSAAAPAV